VGGGQSSLLDPRRDHLRNVLPLGLVVQPAEVEDQREQAWRNFLDPANKDGLSEILGSITGYNLVPIRAGFFKRSSPD